MQNQVLALKSQGVPANLLNSTLTKSEKATVIQDLKFVRPETKILYVTPEMLSMDHFLDRLNNLNSRGLLGGFVVDESHCISVWGHDWRPAYRKLSCLKQKFPKVPILACTATATERTQKDIIQNLGLKDPKIFISSFNRENIHYEVRYKDTMDDVTMNIVETITEYQGKDRCGIVYCHKRAECDEISNILNGYGIIASPYHAGLKNSERKEILEKWIEGTIHVTVATIAFGMGIDNPNVRFVIHHSMPSTLEDYYQESGRGGRDGKQAYSVLYYSKRDCDLRLFLMNKESDNKKKPKTPAEKESQLKGFYALVNYCETSECRRKSILSYFNEPIDPKVVCKKTCDCCASPGLVQKYLKMIQDVIPFTRRNFTSKGYVNHEEDESLAISSDNHWKSVMNDSIQVDDEDAYLKSLEEKEKQKPSRKTGKPSVIGNMLRSKEYTTQVKGKRAHGENTGFQSASNLMKEEPKKKVKLREVSFF